MHVKYAFFLSGFNPLNAELNPICHLLALLDHHILHLSRIRVNETSISSTYFLIHLEYGLYGAETRTLRAADQKYLESFEMWCWRRMGKISWTDHVRNEEVLLRVNEQRISYMK